MVRCDRRPQRSAAEPGRGTTPAGPARLARDGIVVLVTAVCCALAALVRGTQPTLLLGLPFVALLVAVAASDLERRVVPNRVLLPGALLGLAGSAALRPGELPELLAAGAAAFLALLPFALSDPTALGMGDVKLAGVMGLYLGAAVVPALLVALVSGALVGVATVARHGLVARERAIPFAPPLALGGVTGVVAGPELTALLEGVAAA